MKKWCKLSLASLVVPATAGVALVSVGCPSNTVSVTLPELQSNPQVIAPNLTTAQAWWNTFYGSILSEVSDAPNSLDQQQHLFANNHNLNGNMISNIKMSPGTDATNFTLEVTLKNGAAFTDGSNTWKSDPIKYICQIDNPSLKNPKTIQAPGSVSQWVNTFNQQSTNEQKFGEVLGSYTTGAVASVICKQTQGNLFNVTVNLKNGYQFSNGSTTWISNANDPQGTIVFITARNEIKNDPTLKQTGKKIYGYELNAENWFNLLDTKEKKFDAFFTTPYSDLINVGQINIITSPANNSFSVQLTAIDGFYFSSNNANTWTSTGWEYAQQLKIPETDKKIIYSDTAFESATDWFNTFNGADPKETLQNQYNELQQLFKFDTAPDHWTFEKIKSIKLNDNPAKANCTFTITLNDGYTFDDKDHTNTWTSLPLGYSFALPIQPIMKPNPKIAAPYATFDAWLMNKNIDVLVDFINTQLLQVGSELDANKVQSVQKKLDTGGKWALEVTLKSGYSFEDGSQTWTAKGISYVPTYPSLPNNILSAEIDAEYGWTTVQQWWDQKVKDWIGNYVEQFKFLNEHVFRMKPSSFNAFGDLTYNSNLIKDIKFVGQDTYHFAVTITLNGVKFGSGSSVWNSNRITAELIHPVPYFGYPKINPPSGHQGDWLNYLNNNKNAALEWLGDYTVPNTFDFHSEQVKQIIFKPEGSGGKYSVTIILAPNNWFQYFGNKKSNEKTIYFYMK